MSASETEAPRLALADEVMPGKPPINLFRLFSTNPVMFGAMSPWGDYTLGKALSLSMRQREIVIDRVTARCGAEYEWAVHVAYFADRVGFTREQVASLAHGSPDDACWPSGEAVLLRAVDELHDTNDIADRTWSALDLSDAQRLDLLLLAGWYHAISYVARAARVPLDDGVPRLADYARPTDASVGEPASGTP